MRYLLLLHSSPAGWESVGRPEAAVIRDHEDLVAELERTGRYLVSHALEPAAVATTVRVRGGRMLVTDGPFAETREQVGGFYLIEAKDLDEAMAVAARVPDATAGAVEIRPIRDV